MKTKEFIRKMDDVAGAAIALLGTGIHIYSFDGKKVGWVSIDEFGVVDTSYPALDTMKNKEEIVKLMFEYALTPLSKREDEKKYYVHLLPGEDGYLNVDLDSGKVVANFLIDFGLSNYGYKVVFTEEEYNKVQNRYSEYLPKFDENDKRFELVDDQ